LFWRGTEKEFSSKRMSEQRKGPQGVGSRFEGGGKTYVEKKRDSDEREIKGVRG